MTTLRYTYDMGTEMIEEIKPPTMKLILPRLADEEIAELAGWSHSLEVRHQCSAPNFCKWACQVVEDEIVRRSSAGAIEAGSVAIPPMPPAEVGLVLMVLSARTYIQQTVGIGKFFDECLKHVIALAWIQLQEFQTLCEEIQKQSGEEQ